MDLINKHRLSKTQANSETPKSTNHDCLLIIIFSNSVSVVHDDSNRLSSPPNG